MTTTDPLTADVIATASAVGRAIDALNAARSRRARGGELNTLHSELEDALAAMDAATEALRAAANT